MSKCSSLFATPSPRLWAAVNSIRGSSDSYVVFQFREFVDSLSENKFFFKFFIESLSELLPSISSLLGDSSCLRLFLSDSPDIAAMMFSLVQGRYFSPRYYLDDKFVHTFHSPLREVPMVCFY